MIIGDKIILNNTNKSYGSTVNSDEVLSGRIFFKDGNLISGTMPDIESQTEIISTKDQIISLSKGYHDGSGIIKISEEEQNKIISDNIKKGISILGVEGNFEDSSLNVFGYIYVTYPTTSLCTCSNGTITLTAPESNTKGSYTFLIPTYGDWTILLDGDETSNKVISFTEDELYQIKKTYISKNHIYGIRRLLLTTSPKWERTDDAVGFTYTASDSANNIIGSSSFDNRYPWSHIVREQINDDIMVKIPKFWYQSSINNGFRTILIADYEADGFSLHPAFTHNNTTQEYIYVGAYESSGSTSTSLYSLSGESVFGGLTITTFRNLAKNKGDGWGLWDFSTYSAILMLFLVETANNNSLLTTGYGIYSTVANNIKTGNTDSLSYKSGSLDKTGNNNDSIVWRNIENIWGNYNEFIDGFRNYFSSSSSHGLYYSNIQSNYSSFNTSNYTKLSDDYLISGWCNYLTILSLSWTLIPYSSGMTSSTGICDYNYIVSNSSDNNMYLQTGLTNATSSSYATYFGIFSFGSIKEGSTATYTSARLLYVPTFDE